MNFFTQPPSPEEIAIVLLSLRTALVAIGVGLVPAFLLAWLLARKQFFAKNLVSSLVYFPLVIPPVVIGYVLLLLFGFNGVLGKPLYEATGFTFAFNRNGAALAAAMMALPLMVRTMQISLSAIPKVLEEAAMVCGAPPRIVLWRIILPLAGPGVIAALVLGFARALGEFGATITFVASIPSETRTLPLAIQHFAQLPGKEVAAARLVVLSFLVALVALLAVERIGERFGSARFGMTEAARSRATRTRATNSRVTNSRVPRIGAAP